MPNAKNIVKSKTFWSNVLIAVVIPFLPADFNNPVYIGYAVTAINIGLRLISHGKIELL